MTRQRTIGIMIFVLAIVGFFLYAYLLMLSEWSPIVLQLSVLMAVGGILGVISWIGYNMAYYLSSLSSELRKFLGSTVSRRIIGS